MNHVAGFECDIIEAPYCPVHRASSCRVVESGLHASLKEVLDTLSDEETIRVISKVVHAEALEGSRAAITESKSLFS